MYGPAIKRLTVILHKTVKEKNHMGGILKKLLIRKIIFFFLWLAPEVTTELYR